ncbi:hypothetical protein AMS68_003293 [Peltaster fructicola]|uniref:SART-1 protein n=1 Tax=Peltaster fructicola TaxID=286661 RepID=A0A6H0XSX1_9PEZI|nr:hypothetical protein AMS68_003293 [Peltaster fructicola]
MDAASIIQMNKVRASVGLPLLPVPGQASNESQSNDAADAESDDELSTLDKRQAAADKNWQKLEEERLDMIARQKRKDAAKKARDTAARFAKLEGKGLGDADDDAGDLDTRSWLLQQKKRQKKIDQARRLEAELEQREREMQAEYTSKDLAGVRVGHEIDEFDEITGEKILTLKDTQIGEESEDDELENQELRDQEKIRERLQLKKRLPDYDPTEEGEENTVLSKYDEEINGPKQKRFKLDGQGTSAEAKQQRVEREQAAKPGKGVKISLDMLEDDTPVNDYLDPSSIKRAADDDEIFPVSSMAATNDDAMDRDAPSKKRALDFDDDDLQSRLAQQRRETLKKRKKVDAAELARQMREEMAVDEDQLEDGGLLIDETSEFVAKLKRPDTPDQEEDVHERQRLLKVEHDDDSDAEMAEEPYAPIDDKPDANLTAATANGLEDEETMAGQGLGATLALLRKRGIVQDGDAKSMAMKERQRQRFLSERQKLIEEYDEHAKKQREADRRSGRLDKMTHRERDNYQKQQNDLREQFLARAQADMFNAEYKPDVKLEYHDEFGRNLNQKEAFKHLSHAFHGKTSGKQKTEKRLKKIADERKNEGKGMLNVSESSVSDTSCSPEHSGLALLRGELVISLPFSLLLFVAVQSDVDLR